MADRAFLVRLTKRLADEGKLIEAGWIGLQLIAVPAGASAVQLRDMRFAFMSGAQHLFASLRATLDPSDETGDLHRLDLIDAELALFAQEMHARAAASRSVP